MAHPSLPAFSGPDAVCPKCANIRVGITYKEGLACIGPHHDDEALSHQGGDRPRLCRQCTCCGYAWDEAPLDDETVATAGR